MSGFLDKCIFLLMCARDIGFGQNVSCNNSYFLHVSCNDLHFILDSKMYIFISFKTHIFSSLHIWIYIFGFSSKTCFQRYWVETKIRSIFNRLRLNTWVRFTRDWNIYIHILKVDISTHFFMRFVHGFIKLKSVYVKSVNRRK